MWILVLIIGLVLIAGIVSYGNEEELFTSKGHRNRIVLVMLAILIGVVVIVQGLTVLLLAYPFLSLLVICFIIGFVGRLILDNK